LTENLPSTLITGLFARAQVCARAPNQQHVSAKATSLHSRTANSATSQETQETVKGRAALWRDARKCGKHCQVNLRAASAFALAVAFGACNTDAPDATRELQDAAGLGDDVSLPDAEGPLDAARLDADLPLVDSAQPDSARLDAATDAGPLDVRGACGVCDRIWVCNTPQLWTSEADGRCVNQVNRTALRCNGILDGRSPNLGTWRGDPRELELIFERFGKPSTLFCYPP
jgi:hypothetical protein